MTRPVPGNSDPDLKKNGTSVLTPDPVNHPEQHLLVTTVSGKEGSHQMCFQTTNNGTAEG